MDMWIYNKLYWWKPFQAVWSMLHDRCEMPFCSRLGLRGNENIVDLDGQEMIVCDYCWAAWHKSVLNRKCG